MALRGSMERPILGWGQENFGYIFQAHYNPAMYAQEQWFDRAHNVFLDWLVDAGFVGLLAYLALYALFLVYVWKSSLSVAEKSVLSGLLAAYGFNNLFVFDNLASYALFFAILAYVNSFRQGSPMKWLGTSPASKEIVGYLVCPLVVVALVAVIYVFNVRQFRVSGGSNIAVGSCETNDPNFPLFRSALDENTYVANQEVREWLYSCITGFYENPSISSDDKRTYIDMAKDAIKAQAIDTPNDSRSYYLAGSFLDQVGQIGDAEKYLARAHELAPDRQMFDFELAASYLFQKKNDQALAVLKQAYESAPQYDQAAQAYAVALMITGDEADARKIPSVDPKILDTVKSYADTNQFYKAFVFFQGVILTSQDANVEFEQVDAEYNEGLTAEAIQTLQSIESIHPEMRGSVEELIKKISSRGETS